MERACTKMHCNVYQRKLWTLMSEWQEIKKKIGEQQGHHGSVTKSSITLCLSVKGKWLGDAIASKRSYGMYQNRTLGKEG